MLANRWNQLCENAGLNGGAAVLSLSVASNDFVGNPTLWLGLGCRAARGLVDNIRVVPPG